MKWNTLRMSHRSCSNSHLHHSTIIAFFLLIGATCYTSSLFALLPVAFSKAKANTVQINGSAQPPGFSPALLTVHINETVVFINHALPARSYTLVADDGSFSSPSIPTGGQWSITFHAPGSHTYRDTSSTQPITGELLVVEKNVHLLPTPDPLVEATVTALIKNGQNPPDTIIIATHKHPPPPSNSLLLPIILVIGVTISLTLLSVLGITYYKRYRQQVTTAHENAIKLDDDDDAADHGFIQQIRTTLGTMKKILQGYWQSLMRKINKRKDENEDEDEDEDEDENEDEDE